MRCGRRENGARAAGSESAQPRPQATRELRHLQEEGEFGAYPASEYPSCGGRNVRRMGESPFEMSPGELQDRSERLAALVDELGAALRSSGVAEDAASRLLENASAAVLDALTLDLMLPDDAPASAPAQAPEPETTPQPLPLAA